MYSHNDVRNGNTSNLGLAILIVIALGVATGVAKVFTDAMDTVIVAKSNATGKCVYVLSPSGKRGCDFLKDGDSHEVRWVK